MKKRKYDPNQEVEQWKDATYAKCKDLHAEGLCDYLDKTAEDILKNYRIKCSTVYFKSKQKVTV